MLPGDGNVDVDAEHAGEQAGGEFGGELEQCGGARLAGLDAEVFEALPQVGGSDRAAGLPAGDWMNYAADVSRRRNTADSGSTGDDS